MSARPAPWLPVAIACALASLGCGAARVAAPPAGVAPPPAARAAAPAVRPRVVLVVVVDQLVPENLSRLRPLLRGGLGRLLAEGRRYVDAELGYAATETAPGHATLGTGRFPRSHGIVGNSWFSRERGARVPAVRDDAARTVGGLGGGPGASARNLRGPGLAELFERADARAVTFVVSAKDRAALLVAGARPDQALYWDAAGGGFVTSSALAPALPGFVAEFDASYAAPLAGGRLVWDDELLPPDLERHGTSPDDSPGERSSVDGGAVYPHAGPALPKVPSAADLAALAGFVYESPLADALVAALARRAVDALGIGADDVPDLLAVSFSACDTVGHQFGPESREVTDVLLRLDAELGELLAALESRAGRGRVLTVLTADHGVLALPERRRARGEVAARLPAEALEGAVRGAARAAGLDDGALLAIDSGGVWLRRGTPAGRSALRDALRRAGPPIHDAYTAEDLRDTPAGRDAAPGLRTWLARSFDPERSPDVALVLDEGTLVDWPSGTMHGTPWAYDRRVPLILHGASVAAGDVPGPAAPVDVLPTIAARLGLPLPGPVDGTPLR